MTAGQRSDYVGAQILLYDPLPVEHMFASRGHGADCCCKAIGDMGIKPRISSRKNRKLQAVHDKD